MMLHFRRIIGRTPPRWLLAVLGAVLVGLVVSYALIGDDEPAAEAGPAPVLGASGKAYAGGSLPDGGADPVAVAVEALPLALGYDYRSLGAGLNAATALMTEQFATEFSRTFRESAAELARSQQAVTSATVRAAGLISGDDDHALCLVYADQALISSTTLENDEAPVRVSQSRVLVGLAREGDHWRVESIQPF